MRRVYNNAAFAFLFSICPFFNLLFAQTEQQKLSATILHKDSLFWEGYNKCDTLSLGQFFTDDMEFYHDKGGMTVGLEKFTATVKKNLCSNNNFRLRREAVAGSVKVFPMQNANVIYGAIISGEHVFYINETGKEERLDGLAKFTHMWLLKDGIWKMARILSYDHGPASYRKKEITLSNNVIDEFVGKYESSKTGTLIVEREKGLLILSIQNKSFTLYPEAANQFFVKDRDLSFEFIRSEKNKISKMLVRENGQIMEEARFINKIGRSYIYK